MSAQVQTQPSRLSFLRRVSSCRRSSTYHEESESGDAYELDALRSVSSSGSLPQYEALYGDASTSSFSDPVFLPTKHFQIQTRGVPLVALPLPPKPDPIHIFSVTPAGEMKDDEQLAYVSVRPKRGSGNCSLYRGDGSQEAPLCNTFYRFGPGKHPKLQLCRYGEDFEVVPKGHLTRSQVMRTPLGTFEWRYAKKMERRAGNASSLLVLDRVTNVALDGGKQEERRHQVAKLVRNAEYRTGGSDRTTAGNGGRLLMDLREWEDRKSDVDQMEVLVVASCLMMLKKEVDRRRVHQTIAIMSAGGGS